MDDFNEVPIPVNIDSGVNFRGFNFSYRNLIEAFIIFAVTGIISLILVFTTNLPGGLKFSIVAIFSLAPSIFAAFGINNDPLSVYLAHMIKTRLKRRVALYNPRVKYEAKSPLNTEASKMEQEQQYKSLLQRYKEQLMKNKTPEYREEEDIDVKNVVFEDDIGVVKKSFEQMNKLERKQYLKKQKELKKKEKAEKKGGFSFGQIFKKKENSQKNSARKKSKKTARRKVKKAK